MAVRLTTCKNAFEAEVVKGALADLGIECILVNENMSQVYGGIQVMDVDILVDENDIEKAQEYINSRVDEKVVEYVRSTPAPMSFKQIVTNTFVYTISTMFILIMVDMFFDNVRNWSEDIVFFIALFVVELFFKWGAERRKF